MLLHILSCYNIIYTLIWNNIHLCTLWHKIFGISTYGSRIHKKKNFYLLQPTLVPSNAQYQCVQNGEKNFSDTYKRQWNIASNSHSLLEIIFLSKSYIRICTKLIGNVFFVIKIKIYNVYSTSLLQILQTFLSWK